MSDPKTFALVAHDNRKLDLVEWVKYNFRVLLPYRLICTGTTGQLIQLAFDEIMSDQGIYQSKEIIQLKSGPLGGDQQLGALITEGNVDFMIFFWDPMEPHPHDVDVKALLRISVLYNIPLACNRSTADYLISSPLMNEEYVPLRKDYSGYTDRNVKVVTKYNFSE